MKVCIIKESLCIGGTQRSAAGISRALSEEHEVFTMLFDETVIHYPYGGTLVGLHSPPRPTPAGKVWNSFVRSARQREFLLKEKIDIAFLFTAIHGYAILEKMPYCKKIISCRDFKGLQGNTALFAKALRHSDAIVFNSKYQKSYFDKRYPRLAEKTFMIYNIIDTAEIERQSNESVERAFIDFQRNHTDTIISVGRFCSEKGFEHLLRSFDLLRERRFGVGLILVGDGVYRDAYTQIIRERGMERDVFFTGFQDNPHKYTAKCNLFVLSSLSEGFPNVVPEAMTCGLPVVCANCLSGPAEILNERYDYSLAEDGFVECDYGLLTPAFGGGAAENEIAEREMAAAMHRLLSDNALRERYKRLSRLRAADFSQEAALAGLDRVFDYVLGKA